MSTSMSLEDLQGLSYDAIPPVEGMPHGCAWALFAPPSEKARDSLGTLRFLTPAVVAAAGREIQTGRRVQLDNTLDWCKAPLGFRRAFSQKVIDVEPLGMLAVDDELYFNTQGGSQWDGFKHAGHAPTRSYYNGMSHETILANGVESADLGIDKWCNAGGIAGRGVLLDWVAWAERDGRQLVDPTAGAAIPLADLIDVARYQGTEFKLGDILIIRTGFVRWHNNEPDLQRVSSHIQGVKYTGIQADEDLVRWLWEHHFSAIACDAMALESYPPASAVVLHEILLAFWGTPIGELWDLEGLSELCRAHGRWSFFLSSAPLRVPGGVASPPNVIAIF